MKFKLKWILFSLLILLSLQGCVTKGRYQEQVSQSQSLSERLQKERGKSAGLEKEVTDLKGRMTTLESEMEEAKRAAALREKEFTSDVAVLEQQLAVARESKNKTEQQLKDEIIRMKGASEEANQSQQTTIEALRNQLADQTQEIARLKGALLVTEEEAAKRERELQEATQTREDLIGKLEKEISEGSIKISQLKDKLSVEIVDKILFPSGSDQITGEGKGVLKKVSDILKGVKENNIRIEGHTDDVPIGAKLKDRFPSNWELSTSRATQVVRYLSDQGIDPQKLHAVGLSQYHPVTSNETPEGKQRNRRIEIILFPKDIEEIAKAVE
jgi:chemotaxis protein MotB